MCLLAAQVSTMEVDVPMGVKKDFIREYGRDAIFVAAACDFPAISLLVQAALETGWGKYVHANNLYGIKFNPADEWAVPADATSTSEYEDGSWKTIEAVFSSYDSPIQSMLALIAKLKTEPRYERAWIFRHDPEIFFDELKEAGYATDPIYSEKLKQIYRAWPEDWKEVVCETSEKD